MPLQCIDIGTPVKFLTEPEKILAHSERGEDCCYEAGKPYIVVGFQHYMDEVKSLPMMTLIDLNAVYSRYDDKLPPDLYEQSGGGGICYRKLK